MSAEPFTAFTAEGSCRTELAAPDILPLMGISEMEKIPHFPAPLSLHFQAANSLAVNN